MVAAMVPPAPLLVRPQRIILDPRAYKPCRTYQKKNQLALLHRRNVLRLLATPRAGVVTAAFVGGQDAACRASMRHVS